METIIAAISGMIFGVAVTLFVAVSICAPEIRRLKSLIIAMSNQLERLRK